MTDDRKLKAIIQPWLRICEVLLAFDPNDDHEVAVAPCSSSPSPDPPAKPGLLAD